MIIHRSPFLHLLYIMYGFEDMKETLIEYIIQLSFAVHCKTLVEQLRTKNCWGCHHDRPSQIEHDCLMSEGMDQWFDYYEEALERLDLRQVLHCAQAVAVEFDVTLSDNEWEAYLIELKQWPINAFICWLFKWNKLVPLKVDSKQYSRLQVPLAQSQNLILCE